MTDASTWTALAASVLGSVHVRDDLPLQDAHATWVEDDRAVVALADGHGHSDHPRSDVGATLAVEVAVGELRRALPTLAADPTEDDVRRLAAGVVDGWREAVEAHHAADPLSRSEPPFVAYGTTVLAAAVSGRRLVVLQIGDGDIVAVRTSGAVLLPLGPLASDGVHTASLCLPDPLAELRVAVLDADDLALVYACTDGFGTARVEADWRDQTGRQLLEHARHHGASWIGEQLPGWLAEPAYVGGDDTTLVVLVRS
ncbi:PP2C family serine/threonine-protein phosphatase [Nocardioides montaniterrae]